jgi:tetratricopeptide (TPR) repeat protein
MSRDMGRENPVGADAAGQDTSVRGLGWVVIGLTGVATAAFSLFLALYGHLGGPFVGGLDRVSGDLLLEEGARLEAALQIPDAIADYRAALERPFSHPDKRADTLARLGNLLLWNAGPADALPYLEEARDGGAFRLRQFELLCEALLQLRRTEDALACAQEWHDEALSRGAAIQRARAKHYEGRAWEALDDKRAALEAFLEADELEPGGLSGYRAGLICYELGDFERALGLLEAYSRQGTGEKAAWARELCRRIREGSR